MSVDALFNSVSRLTTLAKTSGAQQGHGMSKTSTEDQDSEGTAKLFGALLENPKGKVSVKGEAADEKQSEDNDKADGDKSKQVSTFVLPQNLLALAVNLPSPDRENRDFAAGNESLPAEDAAHAEPALIDSAIAATVLEKDEAASPGKLASSPGDKVLPGSAQGLSDNAPAHSYDIPAEGPTDSLETLPVSDGSSDVSAVKDGGQDRIILQPQQPAAKHPGLADAQAFSTASPIKVRVADVQVVSERSFGTVKTLQIRLDPADLGSVTARIRLVLDGVEVHLVADKAHAAEALAADRSMIEKALKIAGVGDETKLTVTVADRNAVTATQHSPATHSAGHQQAGGQQQSGSSMQQQGFDGRDGAQTPAHFTGGEGRQDGEAGQAWRDRSSAHNAADSNEVVSRSGDRNRGLVV